MEYRSHVLAFPWKGESHQHTLNRRLTDLHRRFGHKGGRKESMSLKVIKPRRPSLSQSLHLLVLGYRNRWHLRIRKTYRSETTGHLKSVRESLRLLAIQTMSVWCRIVQVISSGTENWKCLDTAQFDVSWSSLLFSNLHMNSTPQLVSIVKMEAAGSSETSAAIKLHDVTSQNIVVLIFTTA
jgi:hypothetical protein